MFSIWRNLNPLHTRMLCAKIGWNWLSGPGEENCLILSMYFHHFVINSPLKKGGALHLNKIESPSLKDALWKVWLELAQWFWRRRFLNFVNVFSLFHTYLPWKKGGPFFWTNLNLSKAITTYIALVSSTSQQQQITNAEILMYEFICQSNLPLSTAGTMTKLIKKMCQDSKIAAGIFLKIQFH